MANEPQDAFGYGNLPELPGDFVVLINGNPEEDRYYVHKAALHEYAEDISQAELPTDGEDGATAVVRFRHHWHPDTLEAFISYCEKGFYTVREELDPDFPRNLPDIDDPECVRLKPADEPTINQDYHETVTSRGYRKHTNGEYLYHLDSWLVPKPKQHDSVFRYYNERLPTDEIVPFDDNNEPLPQNEGDLRAQRYQYYQILTLNRGIGEFRPPPPEELLMIPEFAHMWQPDKRAVLGAMFWAVNLPNVWAKSLSINGRLAAGKQAIRDELQIESDEEYLLDLLGPQIPSLRTPFFRYTSAFLLHVELYHFAHLWNIPELKNQAIKRFIRSLWEFPAYALRAKDVIDVYEYLVRADTNRLRIPREKFLDFCATAFQVLRDSPDWQEWERAHPERLGEILGRLTRPFENWVQNRTLLAQGETEAPL